MNIIAVGGDILHIHREHIGKLAGGALHDVQKILRSPENVALLHRLGDGKAPGVDDAVTLSGVDGEDSVQLRGYLLLIDLMHLNRRSHEWHRMMRLCGSIRADVGGNEHISLEAVALLTHIDEFGSHRQSGQGAIAIGHIAHNFRSCTQTA